MDLCQIRRLPFLSLILRTAPFRAAEWRPGGFFRAQDAEELNSKCDRVGPRRSRISRQVQIFGFYEYSSGRVDFCGGLVKDIHKAHDFLLAMGRIGSAQ